MKSMLALTLITVAVLVAPLTVVAAAPASSIDFSALDAAITAQMQKHGLPGVALAVVEGGEVVYLKGYGTAGAATASTCGRTWRTSAAASAV